MIVCLYLHTVSQDGSVAISSDKDLYSSSRDTAVLTCTYLAGPGNTIQWLRGGVFLQRETENVSTIEGLVAGEVFTCIVINTAGTGQSDIILNIEPEVSSDPTDIYIDVNQTAVFCCLVSSYPPAEYEWFKGDGVLPDSVVNSNNICITVERVSFGDEGEYYCTNNITVESNTAWLTGELVYLYFECLTNTHLENSSLALLSHPCVHPHITLHTMQYRLTAVWLCYLTMVYSTMETL